jgi:CheY-like chemotaxis protein
MSNEPTPPPNLQLVPRDAQPIRVLLLDDEPANLHLRTAILRQHGYDTAPASTIEEAMALIHQIDVAVLDYHLGSGKFGTAVAAGLRARRPEVPIIILSATLDHKFGGPADMHLLKGYSSVEDLVNALRSLEAKRRGVPVVVDARDFFYSRIGLAMGSDVILQVLDSEGTWLYVNDAAADYLGHPRDWFAGRNLFAEMSTQVRDLREVILTVAQTSETWIDRTRRGLLHQPRPDEINATWSLLAFPIRLHDARPGVLLSARIIERSNTFLA